MNLRGCEQCGSSQGPGAGVFEPRRCQGLGKPWGCVGRARSSGLEQALYTNSERNFGRDSERAFGKQPARRVPSPWAALFGDGHPPGPAGWAGPPGSPSARGLGSAVTAATRDQSTGTPAASPRALFNHSLANRLYSLPFSVCLLCWLDWREGFHGTSSFLWEGHRWQHMAHLVAPPG